MYTRNPTANASIHVRLTEAQQTAVNAHAERMHVSQAEVVRSAIDEMFQLNGESLTPIAVLARP